MYDKKAKTDVTIQKNELGQALVYNPRDTDVETFKEFMQVGPIVAGVSAGNFAFQAYKQGIISNDGARFQCPNDWNRLDHAMVCVGYGDYLDENDQVQTYARCKNSWASRWGENGYVRIDVRACGMLQDIALAITN